MLHLECWEEQRGIPSLVLEGKQQTARQRIGIMVFQVGQRHLQRCRGIRGMVCYRNIKQLIETGPWDEMGN